MFNIIEWLYLKQKHNLVYNDPATGVYSRYYYDNVICTDYIDEPCSVIFIDVNDLKKTNDKFGHMYGTEKLKRIAYQLKQISTTGLVIRVGGDEFIMIDRFKYSDRKLQKIDNISYGIAIKPAGEPVPYAVNRADAKMYEMKRAKHSKKTPASL